MYSDSCEYDYCVESLIISRATVIARAEGAILLNPFATVSFNMCSVVTVECFVGVFCMFAVV